ncbi:MAG: ABC transporter substrate-binding protein, partial [Candidatus Rokubacteria bacterium]|nr:ABC transporter substrate-binding protein [Candidatus Rokubacteria bacterium]
PELLGKQLELIKEMLPGVSRVAFLWDAAMPGAGPFVDAAKGAAQTLRVQLASVDIASDFDAALAAVVRERPGALLVMPGSRSYVRRQQVIAFSAQHRLPAMYGFEEIAAAGGLMSYGPSLADLYRRAATYVDKILKGAKPADLPVEQPTKFELVVNLKTAKALGLTLPPSILVRTDKVIE